MNVRAKCAPYAAILHAIGVPAPHFTAWFTIATEILSARGGRLHGSSAVWFQLDQAARRQQWKGTVRTARIRMRSSIGGSDPVRHSWERSRSSRSCRTAGPHLPAIFPP